MEYQYTNTQIILNTIKIIHKIDNSIDLFYKLLFVRVFLTIL